MNLVTCADTHTVPTVVARGFTLPINKPTVSSPKYLRK